MQEESLRIPKYFRISQIIIEMIQKGQLRPGMQIPSENEIIKTYEVSNATARKVLQYLEGEGFVQKIKGKGTFVRKSKVERSVTKILSFTKNMLEAGYTPSTRLLHAKEIAGGYNAVINGRKYSMPGPVYKIHRLRFADAIPMMVEVRYISLLFCPDIGRENLEGSLYDIYEKTYGLQLLEVREMLSAVMVDAGIKNFFDVQDAIPGFRLEGVTFCGREQILEMEDSLYRGDMYRFAVVAKR